MATSPTSRTLKWLKSKGYKPRVVERFCQWSRRRIDIYGCGDILAANKNIPGALLVQATASGVTERIKKIQDLESPDAEDIRDWVLAGNELWVVGWRKLLVKRGGKAVRWTPRLIRMTLVHDHFIPVESENAE